MRFSLLLLSSVVDALYTQQTTSKLLGRGCLVSTIDAPQTEAQAVAAAAIAEQRTFDKPLPKTINVDVYFHIASTKKDTNLITQKIVDAQWKVLHDTFAKNNINLTLKSTDRIVNDLAGIYFLRYEGADKGYVDHAKEREKYLSSTRRGGYDALNLYFFSRYLPAATGYCTFPTYRSSNDKLTLSLDGCAISGLTMPGITVAQGGFEESNRGHVAVHETGHWFGLNHTFVGGCNSATGDFVADTPAQRSEIYGCPVGSDSCPDSPGLDPIDNFMGYTADNCTTRFTSGQQKRMFTTFFGFRRPLNAYES